MQPREWVMLALLILVPLMIAVVVTLWSIKQMAYSPKKPARPKPLLSAVELAALGSIDADGNPAGADRIEPNAPAEQHAGVRAPSARVDGAGPAA